MKERERHADPAEEIRGIWSKDFFWEDDKTGFHLRIPPYEYKEEKKNRLQFKISIPKKACPRPEIFDQRNQQKINCRR